MHNGFRMPAVDDIAGERQLFGNRRRISVTSLMRDSARAKVLYASALVVFLLRMVGTGLTPCPHHSPLDPSRPVHGPPSATAMPPTMHHGASTALAASESGGSGSEDAEAGCTCLEGCDTASGALLPVGQFHSRRAAPATLRVVKWANAKPLDARQNAYLAPLPQPPPQ